MKFSYRKGYRFEKDVQTFLELRGWFCARQGKSKWPDFVCITRTGQPVFVECKNRKYVPKEVSKLLTPAEYTDAIRLIQDYNAPFFLFYKENHRTKAIAIGGAGFDILKRLGL